MFGWSPSQRPDLVALFLVMLMVAASSSCTALKTNSSPSSLAHRRDGRFSSTKQMKLPKGRRLAGQYLCTWKQDICEQEPIVSMIGPDCCNSMCTNVKTDMFNCGTCGHICFYGSICCNGICVDVFNDAQNCGSCFNSCSPGIPCQYGLCGYS